MVNWVGREIKLAETLFDDTREEHDERCFQYRTCTHTWSNLCFFYLCFVGGTDQSLRMNLGLLETALLDHKKGQFALFTTIICENLSEVYCNVFTGSWLDTRFKN